MSDSRYIHHVRKIRRIINKTEDVFSVSILIVLCVVVFLQVFFRYVVNKPLAWSEELARFLSIYLVYIASSVVLRDDSHMSMDYVVQLLPDKARAVVDIIGKVIISSFLILAIVKSFTIVRITFFQVSPSLNIPMGVIYAALPISFSLMLIDFITRILLRTREGDRSL
jgi:C4-dicarboxylate transporter DctQ subunit